MCLLRGLQVFKMPKEVVGDTLKKIDDIMCGKAVRMKTGSEFIDGYTDGIEEGSLNVIAARPGNGKTSFIIDLLNGFKEKVAFYSLEMNEWEIGRKMISRSSGINSKNLFVKEFIERNYPKILDESVKLKDRKNLHINCDTVLTPKKIFEDCKGKHFKLIIVDYLQIMKSGERTEGKIIEIGKISQGLKFVAKELGVPIIVLSQLGRGAEGDKIPTLADLRWSGEIEENAHKIIFLHYPHKYDKKQPKNKMIILMPKNRSGEGDVFEDFHVDYSTSKFEKWTQSDDSNNFAQDTPKNWWNK